MKLFRFAGLLVIAAALFTGSTKTATATGPVTCWRDCSGAIYYSKCFASLAQCCRLNARLCPDPSVFQGGDCTDGTNYCP